LGTIENPILQTDKQMTGIDNNIEVRLIYLDTKEEIEFRSIAKAIRFLGTDYKTIMAYMNPINKKRYKHNERLCVVRLKK
jgi:hypothetical protein